jgi:hypothetical protein
MEAIMKIFLSFMIIFVSLISSLFSQNTEEEDAIILLINNAYQALLDRDRDTYMDTWAHQNAAARIRIDNDKSSEVLGWENLKKYYESIIINFPKPDEQVFEYKNFSILIQDDLAWASFDKFIKVNDEMQKQTREFRVLIKENGKWKVLSMIYIIQIQ